MVAPPGWPTAIDRPGPWTFTPGSRGALRPSPPNTKTPASRRNSHKPRQLADTGHPGTTAATMILTTVCGYRKGPIMSHPSDSAPEHPPPAGQGPTPPPGWGQPHGPPPTDPYQSASPQPYGQPGYEAPGYAPYGWQQPPPYQRPSGLRPWMIALIVANVVLGLGFCLIVFLTDPRTTGTSDASVGDCVVQDGDNSVRVISCNNAGAQWKVVGRQPRSSFGSSDTICDQYPGATKSFSRDNGDGSGYTLCLAPTG